jgi:anti-sigma regulatory factor (Ser/Thr protein kinase)
MATVEVTFTPLPTHVRTARLVATAVARRSGVAEALLEEVRLAVGEACSRAVEAHRLHCPAEPVRIALTSLAGRFQVEVTDTWPVTAGPAASAPRGAGDAPSLPPGFGVAVIAGLADDVEISETSAGTSIRMSWPSSAGESAEDTGN